MLANCSRAAMLTELNITTEFGSCESAKPYEGYRRFESLRLRHTLHG